MIHLQQWNSEGVNVCHNVGTWIRTPFCSSEIVLFVSLFTRNKTGNVVSEQNAICCHIPTSHVITHMNMHPLPSRNCLFTYNHPELKTLKVKHLVIKMGVVGRIPLNDLTLPCVCAWPNPGPKILLYFPRFYRWEDHIHVASFHVHHFCFCFNFQKVSYLSNVLTQYIYIYNTICYNEF